MNQATWMDTTDAAAYLRVGGSSTIRTWMSRGLLKPDGRAGPRGRWLFKRQTLDEFALACASSQPTQ